MKQNRVFRVPEMTSFTRFFILAAMALFLAACGNDPNPKPFHEKRPDGSPWLVRYGGLIDEPRSIDPQFSYEETSWIVLEPVIEKLLEYHPMKTDPYELMPCLLESMPEHTANADGTQTYLCKLQRGIFFHDDPCFPAGKGRELVAADALFAWQRIADPKVECPVQSALADYVDGLTEATDAARKNGGVLDYSQPIRGIEIVDDHTFKIHLLKPYPQILYWMAMPFTAPMPREWIAYYDGKPHLEEVADHGVMARAGHLFGQPDRTKQEMRVRPLARWKPVGTGPFIFREYTPGQRIRMERNPHYVTTRFPDGGWAPEREATNRPLAGKALPFIDELNLTIFRETLPVFILARQGYLDAMAVSKDAYNSVVTASHQLTPKYRARGMTLEKDIEPSSFWVMFNNQDPILGPNKKLRQALACAFDAQGWVDIFYNGVAPVSQQLVPPGIFGFQKDFRNPYGPNLEKGLKLIAEAGYPNGRDAKTGRQLELTMDVTATGAMERQMAEYMQRQFEQLGIKIRILENTFARLLEKEDQGNFQICETGWQADYPDPENFFFLFYSKNVPPVGKNVSRYLNPEFDRLFEQMSTMDNSPERLEIVKKMNALLIEDAAIIPFFNKAFYSMISPFAPRTHNNLILQGGVKYGLIDHALREQKRREWNPVARWPIGLAVLAIAGAVGYGVRLNRRRNV